ncbi:MAG: DMT family transporter [Clostridia bacterium]
MDLKKFRGSFLLLIASFIWGTAFVAQSMGNELGAFTFVAARNMVGFLFLLIVVLIVDKIRKKSNTKNPIYENKIYIKGGFIGGLALFVAMVLQQLGLEHTSAGKAGFLTALYIVIVPIMGIALKKKVDLKIWVSVLIATVGTYFLSVTENFTIGLGDIYIILCAVVFSIHILIIDHYSPKTDAIKLSAMQFLVCSVICIVLSAIIEKPSLAQILAVIGPILYAGIMSSGIAFTLQIIAQSETPPTVASLIMCLESVFAVLAGMVILNEVLNSKEILGCVLVFIAVILAQVPIGKKKQKN